METGNSIFGTTECKECKGSMHVFHAIQGELDKLSIQTK